MKKKSKYLLTGLSLFCALSTTLNAATIKETTVNDDGYDTIDANDMILGITRFDSETVITGAKITKASTNDSKYYYKLNNSLDNYETPILYIYTGPIGGWYSLDDNNDVHAVEDTALLEKLENSNIYYVDNIEKQLEVELKDINVDDSTLPKGVTLKDGKLLVNATIDGFEVSTTDGQKVPYIKNEGKFILDQSKYYTVDQDGFITNYTGIKGKVEIPSKINDVNIVGIRSGAFDNKGVTEVVIPESVKQIESNAFSNNALTSVIVNEKYDSGDFTSLANDAFGTFTNDKIKYNNDLTRYMSAFKDELTLKVQKDVDITSGEWQNALRTFACNTEYERLGIEYVSLGNNNYEHGDGGADNGIISYMEYKDENTLTLIVKKYINSNEKKVEKKIKYSIEKVDGENSDIKNISNAIKEYEDYYNKIKTNFKDNTNLMLANTKKANEIFGLYKIKAVQLDYNDSESIKLDKLTISVADSNSIIYTNNILYDIKKLKFQETVTYELNNVENSYDNDDNYVNYLLKKFEDDTKITNYDIIPFQSGKKYMISTKNNIETYIINLMTKGDDECLWTILVNNVVDNLYELDTEGFITNYLGTTDNIQIPSKIKAIGIRSGAFDNKGITEVVIPENIMTIESNAFSNNELTSVIVKEKYDKGDFTSLADDAFGTFDINNITYDNMLTRAMAKVEDNLTINVQKDVNVTDYNYVLDDLESSKICERCNHSIENINKFEGDVEGPDGTFDFKMSYDFVDVNGKHNSKSVSKSINFNINKVDGSSEDIKNINAAKKEYKEYFDNFVKNYSVKNDMKLPSEKIVDIFDNRNITIKGYCGGTFRVEKDGIDLTGSVVKFTPRIYVNNILYEMDDHSKENNGLDCIATINYTIKDKKSNYENDEAYKSAMISKFKELTGISNYEELLASNNISYVNPYNKIVTNGRVLIRDNDTNKTWQILSYDDVGEDELIKENNIGSKFFYYFPNISYNDYDSINELQDSLINKFKEKSGITTFIEFNSLSYVGELNNGNKNSNGNYEYLYNLNGYGSSNYVNIYLYRESSTKLLKTTEDVEILDVSQNGYSKDAAGESKYIKAVENKFITDKKIKKYIKSIDNTTLIKNPDTNKYEEIHSLIHGNTYYNKMILFDYDTNTTYNIYFKMFDR